VGSLKFDTPQLHQHKRFRKAGQAKIGREQSRSPLGYNRPGLVLERRRKSLHQIEQPVAAGLDVRAVLNAARRPTRRSPNVVTLFTISG